MLRETVHDVMADWENAIGIIYMRKLWQGGSRCEKQLGASYHMVSHPYLCAGRTPWDITDALLSFKTTRSRYLATLQFRKSSSLKVLSRIWAALAPLTI